MDTLYGKWQTGLLQSFRQVQDEAADKVVAHFETHEGPHAVTRIFHQMVDNRSISNIQEPVLAEYFQTHAKLPDWADPDKIKLAGEVYERNGLLVSTVLMCNSLPMCYACGYGSHILWLTGRLDLTSAGVDPLVRRVMQTAQFVVDNKVINAYEPDGHGFASALKVRLIHATIRYLVRSMIDSGEWDTEKLGPMPDLNEIGAPINQEDLAGTLMSFGFVILRGLEMLGVHLSDEEKEAWVHQTNIIGYLIGIRAELLPENYADARDLTYSILAHQGRTSIYGQELTKALSTMMTELTPGKVLDHYPFFMMSKFLDFYEQETSLDLHQMIGLAHHSSLKDKIIFGLSKFATRVYDEVGNHFGLANTLFEHFNVNLLNRLIRHFDDGMRAQFKIPEHLRQSWGIGEEDHVLH